MADKQEIRDRLKNIVDNMPEQPGSYQYWDEDGVIIYVGKAKNLKRRVASYFHKEVDRFKTKVLVSKIRNITYTVVKTEEDALLLENSLIKKYKPRYNVLLKDGKTYPSICVTNEPLPRIFKTRTIAADACKNGRIAVNGVNVKPSRMVKVGDTVSVRKPPVTYQFKILKTIEQRVGAKLLPEIYENVTAPDQYELLEMIRIGRFAGRARGTGRPTKKDRRQMDAFVGPSLEGFGDFDFDSWEEEEE